MRDGERGKKVRWRKEEGEKREEEKKRGTQGERKQERGRGGQELTGQAIVLNGAELNYVMI